MAVLTGLLTLAAVVFAVALAVLGAIAAAAGILPQRPATEADSRTAALTARSPRPQREGRT